VSGPRLLIRADASGEIGFGHVVRCLALAEAWIDRGGRVSFAAVSIPPTLEDALSSAGVECIALSGKRGGAEDARMTRLLAETLEATWVALDGYQFDDAFEAEVKRAGARLLALDDFGHARHEAADLVLNQNLDAEDGLYPERGGGTRLLIGSRYTLLRGSFRRWRDWRREVPAVASRMLITLGGGATAEAAPAVLSAVAAAGLALSDVVVLAGSEEAALVAARKAAERVPFPVRIESHVGDVAPLMAEADVSISGGGSTCWELAFMGVPSLIVSLTDHQTPIATALAQAGVAVYVGGTGDLAESVPHALAALAGDPARRTRMSALGRRLVDGRGAERVVRAMRVAGLSFRQAAPGDTELLWHWRNEPGVRAASFRAGEVPWEDHVQWFAAALADPDHVIWICTDQDGTPLAQVRFRVHGSEAEIGVSVDRAWRGSGHGELVVEVLSEGLFLVRPEVRVIHALIKQGNDASRRTFEQAGYRFVGEESVEGSPAWRYTRTQDHPEEVW